MIKRIQFLFLILSTFAFFSCSNQVEKSASINFSLSKNDIQKITSARAATDNSSSETASENEWELKISLSGGYSDEKIYLIQEISENSSQEPQIFILDDLQAGKTVEVDVSIYCEGVQYFKAKETKSVTLVEGENSVEVVLERVRTNSEFSIADSGKLAILASIYTTLSETELPIIISYTKEITYGLAYKISDGEYRNISIPVCEWFLNGNKLDETESSIKLTLAESDYVYPHGTNILTCNFTSDGNVFSTELKFTISDTTSTGTTE